MAYTEANRVQIRRWLGYSAADLDQLRIIDTSITASQSIADGGLRADSSTETAITGWLTQLSSVETAIQNLREQAQVLGADDAKLDAARGQVALFKDGRMYVGFISDALNVTPRRDVFSGKVPTNEYLG